MKTEATTMAGIKILRKTVIMNRIYGIRGKTTIFE